MKNNEVKENSGYVNTKRTIWGKNRYIPNLASNLKKGSVWFKLENILELSLSGTQWLVGGTFSFKVRNMRPCWYNLKTSSSTAAFEGATNKMCFLLSPTSSVTLAPHLLWSETLNVLFSVISETISLNKTERIPSMRVVFPVPERRWHNRKILIYIS